MRRMKIKNTTVSRLTRAVAAAGPTVMELFEPRLLLSASLTYRPQKPDGSLDTPVLFQTQSGVTDFTPAQVSLLQKGFAAPKYDLFLNLTGTPGDSTDDDHPNEISLRAFNWGADSTATLSGGGAGAGKSTLQELHFTSNVSKASPLLLAKLTSGQHLQHADLTVRKPGGSPFEFLKINLADVVISSYVLTTARDGAPVEEFTLNFAQARMEYIPQKADGSADAHVVVETHNVAVDDFAPAEQSLLKTGYVAPAGRKYFLDLANIPGGSTDNDHANQIDVLAFSLGGDATGAVSSGGGAGTGQTTFQELHVVAKVSKASPRILAAMASGQHLTTASLTAQKNGANPFEFLDVNLQDVQVSSYQLASAADGSLVEEFTLAFANLGVDYTPQKPDGTADAAVHFEEHQGLVNDFAPKQDSLLDLHNTAGAVNAFLHITGIPGESTSADNPNDINVSAFSWGGDALRGTTGGGGAGVGKSTLQELHVVSHLSKASPLLLARVNSGQRIQEADLIVRKAGNGAHPEFFRIDLSDVLISSYRVTTAQDGTFLEEYTINFANSGMTYNTLNDDGSIATASTFTEHTLGVDDFAPRQASLLDGTLVTPKGLGLFLNINGVPGESTDEHHQNQLDIVSFGWGADTAVVDFGGGGAGVGKATLHEIHFVANVSKASPRLLADVASGLHISTAHFGAVHLPGGSADEFLSLDLQDLTVTSDRVVVGKNGQLLEEFTLSFASAALDYKPQNNDGTLGSPVHLAINQPIIENFAPVQTSLLDTGFTGPSAFNAFLKITNVTGESTDAAHPNQIDVLSFSWGADATASTLGGGGAGAGKTTFQELHVVSRFSKASPILLARMNSGQHIQQADLAFARPGKNQGDFYTINLADVQVRSYQVTTAKDGTLLEEYTLNFTRGAESYKPQKPDGSLDAPVTFTENGLSVAQESLVEHSPLQDGFVTPPNLSLFLDINGIPGESTADAHPDEIDLLAFSWGGQLLGGTSTGGGGGAGKTVFQQLHFVSKISKASPTLLSRVLSGQHIPNATFTVQRKSSGQDFLKIRLQDVIVSSYQVTTANDGTVTEEFTLTYGPGSTTGPIADAGGPYTVPDNGAVQLDASASTDPNPASLTYAWDLDGDGIFGETGADALRGDEVGINPTFNAAGLFGPAIFNIELRITDGTGATDTASTSVRVIDVTPPDTIILTGPPTLTNQTAATFTFTGTDQGTPADQFTFTASLDGGAPFAVTSPLTLSNLADGTHTLSVVATDQAGNTDPTPALYTWKVDTVGPNILSPLATPSPVSVGVPIALTATASDLLTGASNIAGAQYSLDGMTWFNMTAADGAFNSPSEAVKATLAPLPAGVYTISFRATDAAGNTGPVSSSTLPVFDRNAGKIAGDGTFTSPAGADPAHPAQIGTARIELEAQYKKNDNTPSGHVKFEFGNIKFESTALDYLVITNGNAARLAGSGQINGQGNYAFELTMRDGNPGKGAGNDFFRIRITDKITGQVIYDNGLTTPISAPPQTLLKSGNLKVID